MTYKELQKTGRKLLSYNKYGQGPYRTAYAGTVEFWITPNNMVYVHETNDNSFSYTGRPAYTECLGKVKDPVRLEEDLTAETFTHPSGEQLPVDYEYYAQIYSDIMMGRY